MPANGVRTTDFGNVSAIDDIIGNYEGTTVRFSIGGLISLIGSRIGPSYETRSVLEDDLDWPEGAVGAVYGDAIESRIGVYKKSGATEAGSWTRIGDLPVSQATVAMLSLKASKAEVIAVSNRMDAISTGERRRGSWNPADPFPGGAGVIAGDWWEASAAGTRDGLTFAIGDGVQALIDTPSTLVAALNWDKKRLSAIIPVVYNDVQALQASNEAARGEGAFWGTKNGLAYSEAAPDATDAQIEMANVKLYAKPNPDRFYASQVGFAGIDDREQAEKAVAYMRYVKRFVIDKPCYLPGVHNIFRFNSLNGDGITIEFTNDGELIYDTDGTTPHDYMKFDGCSDGKLIRPKVRGRVMPTTRTAKPALWIKSCNNLHVYEHLIDQVHGSGWLVENSENCTARDGFVTKTLADGHHITNGSIGPSKNCWSYGCTSKDTGDDGFACVSYAGNDQGTCDTIGHLDFYTEGSGARGSSVIGGDNVRMRGIARDCDGSAILVAQEAAFTTHDPRKVDIDVIAHSCGTAANGAIRIGGGAQKVSGRAVSYDAPYAGLQIGDFNDLAAENSNPCDGVSLTFEGYNSGLAGVSCGGWRNLELDITSVDSGWTGAEFFFGNGLKLNPRRIERYSRAIAGRWGLRISASTVFNVEKGIVRDDDSGEFQSLKAVQILTSSNGRVAEQIIGGGSASDLQMEIQDSCVDVVTEQPIRGNRAGVTFTLLSKFFGVKTLNDFTNGGTKALTVPDNATTPLPLNQPAKLFNRGGGDLTISGSVTFVGRSTTVAAGETVTLTQIVTDVWHIG